MNKAILKQIFKAVRFIVSKSGTGKYLGKLSFIKNIEKGIVRQITPEFVILDNHKIYLDEEDALRLSTYGNIFLTQTEREIYYKYIKRGDIVVDVGAFIGDNTLDFARLTGSDGNVYAFEINNSNFSLLVKNIIENNYHNVKFYNKAVSNIDGKIKIYIPSTRPSGSRIYQKDTANQQINWKSEELDAVKLDSVIHGKVDFMKIDTEGAEPLVLEGMQKILKVSPNLKIVLEFSPSVSINFGISAEAYLKRFINMGFKIYDTNIDKPFEKNKKELITDEDINNLIKKYKNDTTNLFLIRK